MGTLRLSDLQGCKPEGVVYANMLNITARHMTQGFPGVVNRIEWFAFDFVGAFQVTTSGEYTFRLHSDDGSILWINGEKVVDNDGLHPPLSKTGSIRLTEGKHGIRVLYFQGTATFVALQL